MSGLFWVSSSVRSGLPQGALEGGQDVDRHKIYVGKAFHNGDWLPAKVIPGKRAAYVCHAGKEIAKDSYEILCQRNISWVPASCGQVPQGAVAGGKTASGETLYVGRVRHNGALTVGKVHPSHKCCYIPFDGKENSFTSYEVLVHK